MFKTDAPVCMCLYFNLTISFEWKINESYFVKITYNVTKINVKLKTLTTYKFQFLLVFMNKRENKRIENNNNN